MNSAILPPPQSSPLIDPRPGRRMLLLIVGLLALPFVLGAVLYFVGWQPGRAAPHGHLVGPPQALPGPWQQESGKNADKWKLLLRIDGACAAECAGQLDALRRIHVALNKNMPRVGRGVLATQADAEGLNEVSQAWPDLAVYAASPATIETLAAVVPPTDTILLLDPQGRLVMTYPAGAALQGVRADLERLLKYTWQ